MKGVQTFQGEVGSRKGGLGMTEPVTVFSGLYSLPPTAEGVGTFEIAPL